MNRISPACPIATRVCLAVGLAGVLTALAIAVPARATSALDLALALTPALAVTVDGTIAANEYGVHINGQNQQGTASSQIWYMAWDTTSLYVGISASNTTEAAVLYLDKNPLVPINGGTNADGTAVGFNYDGASFANLQSRADLVVYIKDGYREYRTANGANGWGAATSAFGSYASNSGSREVAIPWSTIGGRPASFAWFGYITSSGGFVYAPVPTENGTGVIGTAARYERYYLVSNATPGSETKPFSRNCYVFNSLTDETGFGTIGTWDFTMNSTGRSITRGSGPWTIGGDLRVDAGTVAFGATPDAASVSGNLGIAASGTVTLSSAIGGDLNVAGNWANAGTFNPAGRAVGFAGVAAQSITGVTTFDYLSLNNPAGLQLNSSATVNQQFSMTDGKVRTGPNALVIGANATITGAGAARYVIGNLQKPIKVTAGNAAQSFEIGDAGAYTPVALNFVGTATASGSIVASTAAGDHAQIAGSDLNTTRTTNRTWALQNVGTGFTSLDATFNFVAGDLDAGATPANFVARRWGGTAWSPVSVGARTATSTQASGVSALGDFQLGEAQTWTLTASADAGVSIAPAGSIIVNDGADQSFSFHADECHAVEAVIVDGAGVGFTSDSSYTFTNVHADHSLVIRAGLKLKRVYLTAGAGGLILPAAPLGFSEVPCGQPASYMIVPDASHHIADVNVDGVSVGVVSSYTFTNVTVTHALAASFMLDTHTITASAESGVTMTPAGVIVVNDGADQSFSFHADDCRFVEAVIVDGAGIGFTSDSSYTFTNVQADHTLSIVAGVKMFLVHALAGAGGAIAPSGTVSFPCGSSQTFTITPNTGYAIADVLVDGIPRGPVQSWTWTNFREGHSIVATFSDAAPPVVQVIAPNGGDVFGLSQPVLLRWSATDNTGIADVDLLLSRTGAFGPYEMLAAGAPNSGSYTWTATSPASADAWFQVVARDSAGHAAADTSDGAFAIAGPTSVLGIAITEFALAPVTPNPAHAFARVSFELPRASRVRIDVLDVQGRLVRSLVAGEYSAGRHSIDWVAEAGGNRLHAGVYLVRMTADRATFIRRSLWVP